MKGLILTAMRTAIPEAEREPSASLPNNLESIIDQEEDDVLGMEGDYPRLPSDSGDSARAKTFLDIDEEEEKVPN